MIRLKQTDTGDPDFINLVKDLDTDLAIRDGDEHAFYTQFNKIDSLNFAIVAYENGKPAGCGAFKEYDPDTVEVKRMYVAPGNRGKGIATKILSELESRATTLAFTRCILETGINQPEAIGLYTKNGYHRIPNYGPYIHVENSLCFEKEVNGNRKRDPGIKESPV